MKLLTLIVVSCFIGIVPLGAETTERLSLYRLSLSWSGGYEAQPDIFSRTSMLGFGLLLLNKNSLNIQNHITYSTGIMNREDTDIKLYQHLITEKVSIGTMAPNGLFRPYGFLEGRIGWCGLESKAMFENPTIGKFGLGTGVDIFALKNWSFFMELGFLGTRYQDEFIMQQRFELGVKVHFLPLK